MAYHIVKQPDGQYALWDDAANGFLVIDADQQDITTYALEHVTTIIRNEVAHAVKVLDADPLASVGWASVCALYEQIHGHPFDLDAARREWDVFGNDSQDSP